MPLKDVAETGDIIFVSGRGLESSLIKFFSLGKTTHVALVYDKEKIYETDGAWRRSRFAAIDEYDKTDIRIFRIDGLTADEKEKIKTACQKRLGTKYSYWDCAVQGLTCLLNPKLKDWVANKLSNSLFTKCDEETRIVLYQGLNQMLHPGISIFLSFNIGGGTPDELLGLIADRKGFTEIFLTPSIV